MIVIKCDKCGREFSSEIDLEQHQFFEQLTELMGRQANGWKSLHDELSRLGTAIGFSTIQTIAYREHKTVAEAAALYFDRWNIMRDVLKAASRVEAQK